jgi:PiT family inorganic phosphate transporter
VHWAVARSIVWAWILTIPASALIAMFVYFIITTFQRLF